MSEIDKQKKDTENLINDTFDDDDLWALQSDDTSAPHPTENRSDLTQKEEIVTAEILNEEEIKPTEDSEYEQEINDKLAQFNLILEEEETSVTIENKKGQEVIDAVLETSEEQLNISLVEEKPREEIAIIEDNKDDQLLENHINLDTQKKELNRDIEILLNKKNDLLNQQIEIQENLSFLVKEGLKELEEKKQNLEIAIQKLERRKERIEQEMRTTFSGVSQDLAIKVQGFKDYLVGSLQDLALATEQLELNTGKTESWEQPMTVNNQNNQENSAPSFVDKSFQKETKIIRSLLDQYRTRPDYYGQPWQLRRTFEPIHAERVANWFFSQGGKGTIKGMTSRLQNILVASAIISILSYLYGERSRVLILADTPEKLGEWRRGLQDCLGISRSDFGPNSGVVLFETAEALCQKADRLTSEKDLPLVIMDQNEDKVSLSLLQFPLWLAFAPEKPNSNYDYF